MNLVERRGTVSLATGDSKTISHLVQHETHSLCVCVCVCVGFGVEKDVSSDSKQAT